MALLLDRQTIQGLLDMDRMIEILESAFGELAAGSAVMPQRTAVADADVNGWYAFMPAQLKSMGALGVKSVTVYKDNPARGMPATLATIVLMDAQTGQTVAVMDGGYITAMRTGAVSGLATKYLARADSTTAGVMGAGVQARTQLWGMAAGAPNLEKALVFSLDPPDAQRAFADDAARTLGISVETAPSARELVESVDVPRARHHRDHAHHRRRLGEAGSAHKRHRLPRRRRPRAGHRNGGEIQAGVRPSGRLPSRSGRRADSDRGRRAKPRRHIRRDRRADLRRGRPGRESDGEITLFKSVGLSIQDISAAHYVYARALEEGAGTEFAFALKAGRRRASGGRFSPSANVPPETGANSA